MSELTKLSELTDLELEQEFLEAFKALTPADKEAVTALMLAMEWAMSETTMKDLNRQRNPFVCTEGDYPIHSTIWRICQSLAIIDHALDFKEDDAIVGFDHELAYGLRHLVAGLRAALMDVSESVWDLESPPTVEQDNVSKIPGPD